MPEKEIDIFSPNLLPIFSCRPACVQPLKMMAFCQHLSTRRPGHPPVATLYSCFLQWRSTAASFRSSERHDPDLKGRPLAATQNQSGESQGNKGPALTSGQIFRLAVKSYLRLTGCDVWKWYVVTIVETAALLLQSCLHDAQVVVNRRKPALKNINLLVGSEGSDFLYSLNKHVKHISWHLR